MDKYMQNAVLRADFAYVLEKLDKVLKHGVGSSPDVERIVLDQLVYNCRAHYKIDHKEG